jgi:glutathione S-transferase
VLTIEATADGIMEAALAMVYEERYREADKVSAEWIEAQWTKVARALDAVNTRWMSHLKGPMDMGHIAIGCALGYLDLRHEARNWRAGRDGLSQWHKDFAQRPAMAATEPPRA